MQDGQDAGGSGRRKRQDHVDGRASDGPEPGGGGGAGQQDGLGAGPEQQRRRPHADLRIVDLVLLSAK
jgi:hypothetical protein